MSETRRLFYLAIIMSVLVNVWSASAEGKVVPPDRVVEISDKCPDNEDFCQVTVVYPSVRHKRGGKIYVNGGPSILGVDQSNIASAHFSIHTSANLQVDVYKWKRGCGRYISFFQGGRILYQAELGMNEISSGVGPRNDMSLSRYLFTLPAGDVSMQLDGNVRRCKFMVTAGVTGIDKNLKEQLRDLKISRVVIQRGLGSVVDLTALSVTPSAKWNRRLFDLRIDRYCSTSRNKRSSPFDFDTDYDSNNGDIDKTLTRLSWGNNSFNFVRDACNAQGYSAILENRFQELYDALVETNSFKYFVKVRLFDRDYESAKGSTPSLPSETMNAIADALDVSVLNLYVEASQGNCSSYQMALLPFQIVGLNLCLHSGSNVEELGPAVRAGARKISDFPGSKGGSLHKSVAGLIPMGAHADWLTDTDDYVKVKITGQKSWVGASSGLWETTYLAAFLFDNRSKLGVEVDGTVASGAGSNVPPESDFVQSMDQTPGYKLSEFAQRLSVELRDSLVGSVH
ncbi:hypothetical protein [Mesorhizobium sp. M0571]|uniref:hypothetical protein n=1 Tax=Mesorhizobium sp. M0571 TaxID=2956960 RepID=UPI003339CC56